MLSKLVDQDKKARKARDRVEKTQEKGKWPIFGQQSVNSIYYLTQASIETRFREIK